MAITTALILKLGRHARFLAVIEAKAEADAATIAKAYDNIHWAHRLFADGTRRALRDSDTERVDRFLGLIGLTSGPESLEALWKVLDRPAEWRRVEPGGLLAWLARAVYNETRRVRADREQGERLWHSEESEVNRARKHFVDAAGGKPALEALASERRCSLSRFWRARSLPMLRREIGKINRWQGRPAWAGLPGPFVVTSEPQMPSRPTDAFYDDPSADLDTPEPIDLDEEIPEHGTQPLAIDRAAKRRSLKRAREGTYDFSELTRPSQEAEVIRLVVDEGRGRAEAIALVTKAEVASRAPRLVKATARRAEREYTATDLKVGLRRAGVPQARVAQLCRVSAKTVDEWLNGRAPIPAQRYEQLVEILNGAQT